MSGNLILHVSSMTRHRDHALLDMALVKTLVDMYGKGRRRFQVRLFRITVTTGDGIYRLAAWNDGNELFCDERECDAAELSPQMNEAVSAVHTVLADLRDKGSSGNPVASHGCWLPISSDGHVLGCIELVMSRPLTEGQLMTARGIVELFGNYLGLLMYSETDTLTRLLNRKTFENSLQKVLEDDSAQGDALTSSERRVVTGRDKIWLGAIDIDHFKSINDRFGHLFGDEILILVADEMRKSFRRSDRLFRFGGEEFVVLMRHHCEEAALQVFERFRRSIESHAFPQLGVLTVSIGVTQMLPSDTSTTVLGRADDALYYCKNNGRNQVRFHEHLMRDGLVEFSTMKMDVELF